MFIASKPISSGSVRKSGMAIKRCLERRPPFRTEQIAESRRAINIGLLRSEERTAEEAKALSASRSASHSWFFARDSSVISDPAAGGDACGPSIPVGERHEIEEPGGNRYAAALNLPKHAETLRRQSQDGLCLSESHRYCRAFADKPMGQTLL